MTVIDPLLDADPAQRWPVRRDRTAAPAEALQAEAFQAEAFQAEGVTRPCVRAVDGADHVLPTGGGLRAAVADRSRASRTS